MLADLLKWLVWISKIRGGVEHITQIKAIIKAGIPVMGHIGLKPQSVLVDSGYKIHGKTLSSALKIYYDI